MNDTYVELLVKKKSSPLMTVLKGVTITLTVILGLLGLLGQLLFLIGAVICGLAAYFVYLNADLEYEYLYVDRELSVDKVMAKTRRKRVATYELERMEVLAPLNSYHLDDYKNRTCKTVDYSSGVAEQPEKRYAMYYNGEAKVILEPDARLVKAIQNIAPRKVFSD